MENAGRAILLDANLLLLVAVGGFDRNLIGRKRLDGYSKSDFDLLIDELGPFQRFLTTPHLLTEVGNLADQCVPKSRHREFRAFLSEVLMPTMDEKWTSAVELCKTDAFYRLGLADAAICRLVNENIAVLSADAELYVVLLERGIVVQNFNHLRDRRAI